MNRASNVLLLSWLMDADWLTLDAGAAGPNTADAKRREEWSHASATLTVESAWTAQASTNMPDSRQDPATSLETDYDHHSGPLAGCGSQPGAGGDHWHRGN